MDEMNGTNMTFGDAIEAMRVGLKVRRPHWQKTGDGLISYAYIHVVAKTNQHDELVEMKNVSDSFDEYRTTSADILAQDWMVVRD